MNDEITFKTVIDERLASYGTIFNHKWAKQISDLTAGTKLDQPAFALSVNWRAAANTHAFPWVLVESLHGFAKGMADQCISAKFINAAAVEIPKRMAGKISRMKEREIGNEIRALGEKINKELKDSPEATMTREEIWQWFQIHRLYEFHIAVWGSQRLCFTSIFHAYENFIREIVAIAERNPDYKVGGFKELVKDFRKHLGQKVVDECIDHQFLNITRLIRNSLAHNGGRETPDLKALPHNIRVEDGILQIMAPNNQTLISALEWRTLLLAETALKLPQFK